MNKQLEAAQKRVEKITHALEKELGLTDWWEIKHHFVEGHDGDTEMEEHSKVSVYTTCAVTTAQWQYRRAKVTWYLPAVAGIDDDALEDIAVHEYVHVLNSPVAGLVKVNPLHSLIDEFTTETISRVIQRARGRQGPV